jgi:hypothetical protein
MNLSAEDVRGYLAVQVERLNNKRLKVGEIKVDDGTIIADVVTVDNSLVQRLKVNRHTGAIETRIDPFQRPLTSHHATAMICARRAAVGGGMTRVSLPARRQARTIFCATSGIVLRVLERARNLLHRYYEPAPVCEGRVYVQPPRVYADA